MFNLIIYGKSDKFISAFSDDSLIKSIEVIKWRDISAFIIPSNSSNYILIICGFNHNIYNLGFDIFMRLNVYSPFEKLKDNILNFKEVIYLDTINSKKIFSLSYYVYAKSEFKRLLLKERPDLKIVEIPSIVNLSGWPDFYGNFIEKFLAYLIIKFKKISVLSYSDINQYIYLNKRNPCKNDFIEKKLIFYSLPRNRFFDKVLRVIYG